MDLASAVIGRLSAGTSISPKVFAWTRNALRMSRHVVDDVVYTLWLVSSNSIIMWSMLAVSVLLHLILGEGRSLRESSHSGIHYRVNRA